MVFSAHGLATLPNCFNKTKPEKKKESKEDIFSNWDQ